MVLLHLAEGQSGLALANRLQAVTLVVDVLRASTTLAVLASRGPRALYVTREVERARKLALERPGTVLAGERGGLPPEGFALGNSPSKPSERYSEASESSLHLRLAPSALPGFLLIAQPLLRRPSTPGRL